MDFDNMTREELLEVLKESYIKLVNPIPHSPTFIVGHYYRIEQTGNDDIEVYGEDVVLYLTFEETDRYFK